MDGEQIYLVIFKSFSVIMRVLFTVKSEEKIYQIHTNERYLSLYSNLKICGTNG